MTNTPITNTAAPATKKRPTDTPTAAAVDRSATRRRSSLALSLAAVGGLAVAACGGGSSNDDSGIASLDGAGDGESAADIDPELAMADYRECLADNGANIDVQVGGGGSISIGGGVEADPQAGGIGGTDPDTFRAAVDACAELGQAAMGAFAPDPQQQAALDDAQLRFEECMDDKGLGGHVGSMMTSNAGIGVEDSAGADDPQSGGSLDDVDPDVLADALDECGAVFDELEAS